MINKNIKSVLQALCLCFALLLGRVSLHSVGVSPWTYVWKLDALILRVSDSLVVELANFIDYFGSDPLFSLREFLSLMAATVLVVVLIVGCYYAYQKRRFRNHVLLAEQQAIPVTGPSIAVSIRHIDAGVIATSSSGQNILVPHELMVTMVTRALTQLGASLPEQEAPEFEMSIPGSKRYPSATSPKGMAIIHNGESGQNLSNCCYGVLTRTTCGGRDVGVTASHVWNELKKSQRDIYIRSNGRDYLLGEPGYYGHSPPPKPGKPNSGMDVHFLDVDPVVWTAAGIKKLSQGKTPTAATSGVVYSPHEDGSWTSSFGSTIEAVGPFQISHGASTVPGSSGSPFLVNGKIVLIHTRANLNDKVNVGTSLSFLDGEVFESSASTDSLIRYEPPEDYYRRQEALDRFYDEKYDEGYEDDRADEIEASFLSKSEHRKTYVFRPGERAVTQKMFPQEWGYSSDEDQDDYDSTEETDYSDHQYEASTMTAGGEAGKSSKEEEPEQPTLQKPFRPGSSPKSSESQLPSAPTRGPLQNQSSALKTPSGVLGAQSASSQPAAQNPKGKRRRRRKKRSKASTTGTSPVATLSL